MITYQTGIHSSKNMISIEFLKKRRILGTRLQGELLTKDSFSFGVIDRRIAPGHAQDFDDLGQAGFFVIFAGFVHELDSL